MHIVTGIKTFLIPIFLVFKVTYTYTCTGKSLIYGGPTVPNFDLPIGQ